MPVSLSAMRDLIMPNLRRIAAHLSQVQQAKAILMPQLTSMSSDMNIAFDIIPNPLTDSLDLVIANHGDESRVYNFITRAEIEDKTYLIGFYDRVVRCVEGHSPQPVTDHSAFSLDELQAASDYIQANK